MRTIQRRIVSIFVVSKDGKVLMGRKRPGSGAVYEDCWHKPGGGVEGGESDEEAIAREVLEETGIDLGGAPSVLVYDKDGDTVPKRLSTGETVLADMKLYNYKVMLTKNAADIPLADTDELTDLTWFDVGKLESIKVTPPMQRLLSDLGTKWLLQ